MSAAPQGQETGHLPSELALVPGRTKAIPRQELGSGLPKVLMPLKVLMPFM